MLQMAFVLYCSGNNDEEVSIHVHYRRNFPPNTFNLQLIESNGAEPADTEFKNIHSHNNTSLRGNKHKHINIKCGVVAGFNFLFYLHPCLLFSRLSNRKIICCFVDVNQKSNTELLFWRMLETGHSQGDEGGLEGDVSPVRVELKDTILGRLHGQKKGYY